MRCIRMKRDEKNARPAQPVTRMSPGMSRVCVFIVTIVPGIGTCDCTNDLFWSVLHPQSSVLGFWGERKGGGDVLYTRVDTC